MRQECVFYQVSEIPYKFVHVVFKLRAIPNFNLPQRLSPGNPPPPVGEGGPGLTRAFMSCRYFKIELNYIWSQ